MSMRIYKFLSTLSLRRATFRQPSADPRCGNFYPRSPCGERPGGCWTYQRPLRFLSTLSLRRATADIGLVKADHLHFYPRSPCGERRGRWGSRRGRHHFYPRSPCGERLEKVPADVYYQAFLSTLSLRRATWYACSMAHTAKISIHALLAESDIGPVSFFNTFFKISIHALLAESDNIGGCASIRP